MAMQQPHQRILRADVSGMPLEWVTFEDAIRLYYNEQVAYPCGETTYTARGGTNARTGRTSSVEVNSIIATYGNNPCLYHNYTPPLNNAALFRRDRFMCLYCGEQLRDKALSRDHVRPLSLGGKDRWQNVVTACRGCNNLKAGRTPEAAGMQLLAIPFVPTHAEYVYLQARTILADQMEFLLTHFPRSSPLRKGFRH